MGWNADIDWTDSTMWSTNEVMGDIVRALTERFDCKGWFTSTPNADSIPLYPPLVIANLIDADITYLAGLSNGFVDLSSATGGEFVGVTSIPMISSEAILLAAIGASSRILSSTVGITKEWVAQVYEILNVMTWVRGSVSTLWNPSYDAVVQKQSIATGYAAAVAAWPTTWSSLSLLTQGPVVVSTPSGATVYLTRQFPSGLWYYTTPCSFTHDADLYFYTIKPFGSGIFDPQDTSFLQNKYNRFGTHSGRATGSTGGIDFTELLGSAVPVDPAGVTRGFTADARRVGPKHYAVIKFDVTGGFEFVAP